MTKVEYPRLQINQKRSAKLTNSDVKKIKEFFEQGMKISDICKAFNVTYTTIKYHCDPKYKKYLREWTLQYQKDKLKDPDEYRKHLDADNKLKREKYHNDPEYRKYRACVESRWRKNNPERMKELRERTSNKKHE